MSITKDIPHGMLRTDPMLPDWYRIQRVHRETRDTFTWRLAARDHDTAWAFNPGQFNMLYLPGVGEVPISISGDPHQKDCIVHTTRAAGSVTRAMWRLTRGAVIGIRGPFGSSWPVEAARGHDILVVAGGIGLAPLRPFLYHVMRHRKEFGRLNLIYGARTPDDLLYRREFPVQANPDEIDVSVTVDRATGHWDGPIGVVTTLIPRARFSAENTIAMICGPEVMMRFSIAVLNDLGIDSTRIYISMERNMKCAIGFCGHCQYGARFICKDGPVFRYDDVESVFGTKEL